MQYRFLISIGRTGTQLLSRLLGFDPRASVYHEPYASDAEIMQLRYAGFNTVADGRMAARMEEMTRRSGDAAYHVESNSYLRFETGWLRRELDAKILFLCRDGRTYLPSAYPRDVYTAKDLQFPQVPHDDDPWAGAWAGFSRFEKICWYWDYTNRRLMEALGAPVHMEEVMHSYDGFTEHVAAPLDLRVDRADWERQMSVQVNHSSRYLFRKRWRNRLGLEKTNTETLPPAPEWTPAMRESFDRICGETQEKLGYAR
jgi:hypothetical protein